MYILYSYMIYHNYYKGNNNIFLLNFLFKYSFDN